MKKGILNYLVIAIIVISAAFTSCSKNPDDNNGNGNENVYLLVEIEDNFIYKRSVKLEYDYQNHVKKMIFDFGMTYLFDYNDAGDLISMKWEDEYPEDNTTAMFTKNGNKIILNYSRGEYGWSESIELNTQGLPTKYMTGEDESSQFFTFQYQNGNLKKLESLYLDENDNMIKLDFYQSYTYDDKKSPFYHCKTPKWLFVFLDILLEFHYNFGIQNNVVTSDGWYSMSCDYTYNDDGFPFTRNVKGTEEFTQTFKYGKR